MSQLLRQQEMLVIGKEVDFNTLKEGDIITTLTTVDEQKILNTLIELPKVISNGKGSVPSFKTKKVITIR